MSAARTPAGAASSGLARLTGGTPVMGRSILTLRRISDGPLAWLHVVAMYFWMTFRPGRGREHRLRLRLGGEPRDWYVADAGEIAGLWEVFISGDYEGPLPASAETIFDVGANTGAATAWLRTRYPAARIVSVEPDPATAARLRRNVGGRPGITVVEAAVSDEPGSGVLARSEWTMLARLDPEAQDGVPVTMVTLEQLREEHAAGADIDIMKLDTEGGEWTILAQPLARIGTVVMETHEPTPDGRPPTAVLTDVAARDGYELRDGHSPRISWLVPAGRA